jgi:hypothetical protein
MRATVGCVRLSEAMRRTSFFHSGDANRNAMALGFQTVSVPIWLVALVAAAAAPSCVRLYASSVERRARLRTERALASAQQGTHASLGERASKGTSEADSGLIGR